MPAGRSAWCGWCAAISNRLFDADTHRLDVLDHPNDDRYPGQRIMVIAIDGYAWLVPFVALSDHFFLKTMIPSRKATRDYGLKGD